MAIFAKETVTFLAALQTTTIMLIDTHAHLDQSEFDEDRQEVIDRARDAGVERILAVAIDADSAAASVQLAAKHEMIFAAVGMQPNYCAQAKEGDWERILALVDSPKVIAIGETGLDYFRSDGDLDWQRERFRTHIRAAKRCGKPLIIHTRAAKADTIQIMQEEGAESPGGVMHCFTEDWPMARQALEMGFYISFSGIITFKNAADLREVVKQVPMEQLLIETDSPYLAPVPHRGKPNQPLYVNAVAECVAQLKGLSKEAVAAQTKDNFYRCFPLAQTRG